MFWQRIFVKTMTIQEVLLWCSVITNRIHLIFNITVLVSCPLLEVIEFRRLDLGNKWRPAELNTVVVKSWIDFLWVGWRME